MLLKFLSFCGLFKGYLYQTVPNCAVLSRHVSFNGNMAETCNKSHVNLKENCLEMSSITEKMNVTNQAFTVKQM